MALSKKQTYGLNVFANQVLKKPAPMGKPKTKPKPKKK